MTGTAFSRKSKALTIVPLALLSGAWTVSLVNTSAGASGDEASSLPDGTSVPSEAIEAPASVPQRGVIAPGVPAGSEDQVVASASSGGIPSAAISAYQRGAQIINAADTTCNIPWELLAAIGRVESNHGRYGGNTLNDKGVATPGIYGISLNGKNGTQAIHDTDAGELDKDKVYDRAVGPMQFIPSTWAVVKVDADGDGERNPQDIDDAALGSAVYLCSGKENLGERKGQETSVFRYNHSKDYVNLVLRLMEAYQQGEYTAVPSGSYGGNVFTPSYASTGAAGAKGARAGSGKKSSSKSGTKSGQSGSTTPKAPGTGTGGTGGLPGSASTSGPNPLNKVTEPVEKTVKKVTEPVKTVTTPVTKPVVETLDKAAAEALCDSKLNGLLQPWVATCTTQSTGKTRVQALGIIANLLG